MMDFLHDLYFERRDDMDVIIATVAKAYMLGALDALLAIEKILEEAPTLSLEEVRQIIASTVQETVQHAYKEANSEHSIYNRAFLALQHILKKKEAPAPQTGMSRR